ncbi:MAG TPA: hypothetical protein VMY35_00445 [Phycisphaerae bacterium]|nr:hypothetical protein [Phycisphaerae bacterium]
MPKVSREGWVSKSGAIEWRRSGIFPYLCSEAHRRRCVEANRNDKVVTCIGCHRVRVTVEDFKEDE